VNSLALRLVTIVVAIVGLASLWAVLALR